MDIPDLVSYQLLLLLQQRQNLSVVEVAVVAVVSAVVAVAGAEEDVADEQA